MAFECGIHISCSRCEFEVCANEAHPQYDPDPFVAAHVHKVEVHGDFPSGSTSGWATVHGDGFIQDTQPTVQDHTNGSGA